MFGHSWPARRTQDNALHILLPSEGLFSESSPTHGINTIRLAMLIEVRRGLNGALVFVPPGSFLEGFFVGLWTILLGCSCT